MIWSCWLSMNDAPIIQLVGLHFYQFIIPVSRETIINEIPCLAPTWGKHSTYLLTCRLRKRAELSESFQTNSPPRDQPQVKRRRVNDETQVTRSSTTSGLVSIVETDNEGNFIKLHNPNDSVSTMYVWCDCHFMFWRMSVGIFRTNGIMKF